MTVVALQPERVAVWSGTPQGCDVPEWYVEWIEAGHEEGTIVTDRPTEAEALEDAREWDLPVFIRR